MSELTDDRLLPCPFCGSPAALENLAPANHERRMTVGCSNEDCFVYLPSSPYFARDAEAIAAWNRRAAASTSTEAVGVKALEWVDRYDGDDIRGGVTVLATSILGVYQVWGDGSWSNRDRFITGHGNLDDGLAAAQADFEARIRSSLTPPTPKVTTDEAEERE